MTLEESGTICIVINDDLIASKLCQTWIAAFFALLFKDNLLINYFFLKKNQPPPGL